MILSSAVREAAGENEDAYDIPTETAAIVDAECFLGPRIRAGADRGSPPEAKLFDFHLYWKIRKSQRISGLESK